MIFRYNLSEEITSELEYFATINRNIDRHVYKERWEKWVKEKETIIGNETDRLTRLGYEGDVRAKMYKSVRYYVATKTENAPKQRRKYLHKNKDILQVMDTFLLEDMKKENFTPRQSYLDYCQIYGEAEKKMFKNRYYRLRPLDTFQKSGAF